ncbi:NAD-dependent epimerase/dehydratase family protein [Paracoccus suum]|uniref:NAD-dependent epimerase/dehydratase family protein n=1 Tax=Paracoccus suum TaxID=2259340 RepID=A0A344PGC1_9RHOB|nr:NAD-dependent epimerase/dehydratase family protein [Paracoccus suum]AXC48426.1 NAD-dependent epimerase/dehydratase family protein [Paracoccus suum]
MSTRRAIVTGAGGFVGGAIAAALARHGHAVTALDRSFDEEARGALARATLIECDLGPGTHLPPAELVIHAAALTTGPRALGITPAAHLRANLDPLLAVLESVSATPPKAFVFLSSSGVFAPQDGRPDLDDDAVPTGASPYAAAKLAGERIVPAALAGLCDAHVVRLGHIYGPDERSRASRRHLSPVALWRAAAAQGQALEIVSGDPRRDWTWAPDIGAALALLVDEPGGTTHRPIHLASPHIRHDSQMCALIAPGAPTREAPAQGAIKGPMIASQLSALTDFPWTSPENALPALAAGRRAA